MGNGEEEPKENSDAEQSEQMEVEPEKKKNMDVNIPSKPTPKDFKLPETDEEMETVLDG